MRPKNKVIIKNTTSRQAARLAFSPYRDQLGVIAAEDGDVVIMRKAIEENFHEYLYDLGIIPKNVVFITRRDEKDNDRFDIIFDDPHIAESVRSFAHTHELFPFYVTDYELKFSEQTGLPLRYKSTADLLRYNNKSDFRKLLKRLNIPLPFGCESVPKEGLIEAVDLIFNAGGGKVRECAVIKHDQGSAGNTNIVVHHNIFAQLSNAERWEFLEDKLRRALLEKEPGQFIVEEWLPAISASPSIFFECLGSKNYNRVFLHDQVLGGSTRYYNGCVSQHDGIDQKTWTQVDLLACRILDNIFSRTDHKGFAGFDAIVVGGKAFMVDANIRLVSGYFPVTALRKLVGEKAVSYFNSNINVPLDHVTTAERLLKFLQPLLYSSSTGEGIVILGTFPYHSQEWYRHIDYLCITKDHRSLWEMTNALMRILFCL